MADLTAPTWMKTSIWIIFLNQFHPAKTKQAE
jgi:hypothetical protein